MSYIHALKNSLFKIDQLQTIKDLKFGKAIAHLLFLSLILAIPISAQVVQIFGTIRQDGQQIAENIPDFTIQEGHLVTEKNQEGFIYQTDSIIFTFDPEGKRTAQDISEDMLGNLLSVGLLQEGAVITLPATESVTSILGSNQLSIPYSSAQISQLTGKSLRQSILENQLPWWIFPLTFLVALYPAFISLIFTMILATLFANLIARFRGLQPRFLNNLKIIIFCSTVPVLVTMILNLLNPSFIGDTFILIGSVFIFSLSIKPMIKKTK